jgi:hypothetical protein
MKIKIGTVETPFHEMSLKIKTVADSFGWIDLSTFTQDFLFVIIIIYHFHSGDDTIPQAEAAESYLAEDDSDDEEELDEDIAPTQNFSEEQPDQEEEQQSRPAFSREDPYGGILPVQNAPNPQEVDICESMNKFNLSASEGDNQSKSEVRCKLSQCRRKCVMLLFSVQGIRHGGPSNEKKPNFGWAFCSLRPHNRPRVSQ